MKPDLTGWLGRTICVRIDRPIHSVHPERPGLVYEVNYGFVPDTVSGDGEEIDAYVLGVDEPLDTFRGLVVAIAVRADDCEDKLIVAPLEASFSDEEIMRMIAFQERYFRTTLRR